MARKKSKKPQSPLPQVKGEVWEIGRRGLDVHVADLESQGERPDILLAIQIGEHGGVVLGDAVPSSTPTAILADFTLQAMRQPLLGQPRRPEVVRVGSRAEAEILAVALATTGVAVEVSAQLDMLDIVHQHLGSTFGGLTSDYRSQAEQAGETLSEAGLHEFFRAARAFYREEMWLSYGDEAMLEITLQPAQGPSKTQYGIMMGSMGEEFGLALFPSLDDLQRFYDLSIEHLDTFADQEEEDEVDLTQQQHEADVTAKFLQVPSISLTYTPQRDVAPPLVQEAQHLKLPLANKSAFPLVMRTGQGGMQIATATDLGDMLSALRALLDWDQQLDTMDVENELEVTVTSKLPAVADFLPELTARTTLRENPCTPEESDDALLSEFSSLFESLLTEPEPPRRKPAKKSGQVSSGKKAKSTSKKAAAKTTGSDRVYTLDVYLMDGPISEAYAGQEISRRIDILGRHTLHDLHKAIFEAFERWEEHLYEFNLGEGPGDRSQIYFYSGGWDNSDEEAGDPQTTPLAALDLSAGHRFGYTFDMGDEWEHVIEVVAIKEKPGKGKYPRVVKEVGAAPPQYPEEEDDDDVE